MFEVEYTDGTKATLSIPSEEEFAAQDKFFRECMDRFFPGGIPVFDICNRS